MTVNAMAIVPLLTLLCYLPLLGVYLKSRNRSKGHVAFVFHLSFLVLRSFGSFMLHANLGLGSTDFWQRFLMFGLFGASATQLDFAHSFVGRRDRWVVYVGYALTLLFIPFIWTGQMVVNSRIEGGLLHYDLGPAAPYAMIPLPLCSLLSIYMLASYYHQETNPLYRKRLLYPLIGICLAAFTGLLGAIPAIGRYPIDVGASAIKALLISYSLLRYRWLDTGLVIRKGLAHVAVTLGIMVIYLLGAVVFQVLLQHADIGTAFVLLLVVAAAMALLLRPWRTEAQSLIDRVFFPRQYDSGRTLEDLAETLKSVLNMDELAGLLIDTVVDRMSIGKAAILLPSEETGFFSILASRGFGAVADSITFREDHPLVRHLIRTGRPLDYADVERVPQFHAMWSREREDLAKLAPQIFFPLIVHEELIGILIVGKLSGGRRYSLEDRRTLHALASQGAVAVENAYLYSEARHRANELELLLHSAEAASSTLELTEVLEVTARLTAQACQVNRCSILLIDESTGAIKPLMSQFASGEHRAELWRRFRHLIPFKTVADIPPLRRVCHSREPLIAHDCVESGLPSEWIDPFGIQSLLVVPLTCKDRCIGIMALDHSSPDRRFTPGQVNLAILVANEVAIAIENARLFEAERAERLISETLREASSIIASTLDLDDLLQLILVQLEKVVAFDRAAICLLQGDMLRITAFRGNSPSAEDPAATTIPRAHPFFQEMEQTRQPMIVGDARELGSQTPCTDPDHAGSWLGAPLGVEDQMIGFLCLERYQRNFYSPRDAEIVLAMANHAALAIEKARLYRQAIEERQKAESILHETFNGIIVIDTDLVITALNAGAEIIVGYEADEVLGQRLVDVFGPEMWGEGSPVQRAVAHQEKILPEEVRIAVKDGMRDILQGVTPLRDDSDRVFGYLLSIADVTHLKEIDRLKSSLVANVSHELRAPLASIKAYTELLLDDLEGDNRALRQQFLTVIDQETDRLSALISDILDLSRLESGQQKLRREQLDFQALIDEVMSLFSIQAAKRGIAFEVDIPVDLAPVMADEEMMLTITKNLLSNAIKFNCEGGTVRIEARHQGAYFTFSVIDEGIGIQPDEVSRLFRKFYRARSVSEAGIQGTGLGLVLVKEAVEAHGGTVEVESEPGSGSRFTVIIPQEHPDEPGSVPLESRAEIDRTSEETPSGSA